MRRTQKIAINSHSSGKFWTAVINQRPHLITEMVSIVGDSVMNGLHYSLAEVKNSFHQLKDLPAPSGHPTAGGTNISAFHPLAINTAHMGAFVTNPRMVGDKVINHLCFDIETAQKHNDGIESMRRIEAGEEIGVSTGLNAGVDEVEGVNNVGVPFHGSVKDIQFDHVAVLLNDTPAGSETFTINQNKDVMLVNLADSVSDLQQQLRTAGQAKFAPGNSDHGVWIEEVLLNPDMVVFDVGDKLIKIAFGHDDDGKVVLTGEGVEVKRKIIFQTIGNSANEPSEASTMNIKLLIAAFINSALTSFTAADEPSLLVMTEDSLAKALCNAVVGQPTTLDQAMAVMETNGLTVNAADFKPDEYKDFLANKSEFDTFLAAKAIARSEKEEELLKINSKLTEETVKAMPDELLNTLIDTATPSQDYSGRGSQGLKANDRQSANADDHDVVAL